MSELTDKELIKYARGRDTYESRMVCSTAVELASRLEKSNEEIEELRTSLQHWRDRYND